MSRMSVSANIEQGFRKSYNRKKHCVVSHDFLLFFTIQGPTARGKGARWQQKQQAAPEIPMPPGCCYFVQSEEIGLLGRRCCTPFLKFNDALNKYRQRHQYYTGYRTTTSPPAASTVITESRWTVPSRMLFARRFTSSRCITRFTGRAP